MLYYFSSKFWMVILIFVAACSAHSQSTIELEPLGEVVIPYNQPVEGAPVGGLSGLSYDQASGNFYVISDDRSEFAPARFYRVRLQLGEDGRLAKDGIVLDGMTILKTPAGEPYAQYTIDPEGIAVASDSLVYVTSEGGRSTGEPPFVNAYRKDGAFVKSLPVPDHYWAPEPQVRDDRGIRTNLAFESLTVTPDSRKLFVATENALEQDGPVADTASVSPSRIIEYDRATGEVLHEYRYDVNRVFVEEGERGAFAVNGLSDLQALDDNGRLLALDRNYVQGQGNRIGLYEVSIHNATDIKGMPDLEQATQNIVPARKQLIADLSTYGITIDNYEGLTFGAELPGGGRLLLIVSDNNFSTDQQTIFTAFRLFER